MKALTQEEKEAFCTALKNMSPEKYGSISPKHISGPYERFAGPVVEVINVSNRNIVRSDVQIETFLVSTMNEIISQYGTG